MLSLAKVYREEVAEKNPFEIISEVDRQADILIRMIQTEKTEGSAHGVSDANNLKLKDLGKAAALTSNALREIANKFPNEYLNLRAEQEKNRNKNN